MDGCLHDESVARRTSTGAQVRYHGAGAQFVGPLSEGCGFTVAVSRSAAQRR